MTVKDFLGIWKQSGAPYVRIIDVNAKKDANRPENGAGVMLGDWYTGTCDLFGDWKKYEDCEVIKFYVTHEVSHKKYKELGLIPPYRRDITAEYEIGDLKQKTYYDIVIDGKTVKGEQDKEHGKTQLWQSDGLVANRETLEEVLRTFRSDGVQGIESQQALEGYIKKLPESSLREMCRIDAEAALQILSDCFGILYAAEKYSRWKNETHARRDRPQEL